MPETFEYKRPHYAPKWFDGVRSPSNPNWEDHHDITDTDTEESVRWLHKVLDSAHGKSPTEAKFNRLTIEWQSEDDAVSSVQKIAMRQAYQKMIGMGKEALPLILGRLKAEREEPSPWFWALAAIADENPVPKESRGRITEMADAWLKWGQDNGYVKLD